LVERERERDTREKHTPDITRTPRPYHTTSYTTYDRSSTVHDCAAATPLSISYLTKRKNEKPETKTK